MHFWHILEGFFTSRGPVNPKEVFAEGGRTLVLDPRRGDGFILFLHRLFVVLKKPHVLHSPSPIETKFQYD